MKKLLYAVSVALVATSTFISCKNTTTGQNNEASAIIGTWHYQTMDRTVYGADIDTLHWNIAAEKDSMQFYDVYRSDSVLEFYLTQGDSLLEKRKYHYIVRNDTIFAKNEEKELYVHIMAATDNALHFDYTRISNDSTYYFKTVSKRSELPDWLLKKLAK